MLCVRMTQCISYVEVGHGSVWDRPFLRAPAAVALGSVHTLSLGGARGLSDQSELASERTHKHNTNT